MAKVNGKGKGNKFERDIANIFSERFQKVTGVEKGFRRNADSGSYFGGQNVARTETHNTDFAVYGDLVCPRNFEFSVECKHYKTAPTLNSILKGRVSEWDTWLAQNRQDADAAKKRPLLIVKYNRTETLVFLDFELSGQKSIITYQSYHIYSLEQLLKEPDSLFFNLD